MFLTIKPKAIIAVLIIFIVGLLASFCLYSTVKANASSKINYTIVLDAGHGGIDGGCVGTITNVTEAELNLKVVKKLESLLNAFGFKVVLTRSNNNGLYSQFSNNKKVDDMETRKKIIEKSKADMVVSVHMNSFSDPSQHGAQTFFQVGSQKGESLGTCIQNELAKNMFEARGFANHADLFILKCTQSPSVVVEGGFLTNQSDEQLLVTDEYQSKLAYSIFCGIVKFYELENQI